jgi:hypothetical protein
LLYLKGISRRKRVKKTKAEPAKQLTEADVTYLPTQNTVLDPETDTYKKNTPKYGNFTNIINSKYEIQEI